MQEDLLPVRHLNDGELVSMLAGALGRSSLPESLVSYILKHQLRMRGSCVLHSARAAKNGGDFDFDTICAVPSDQFPKFVRGRIAYGDKFKQKKTKHQKAKSPWWNVYLVAMKARGNKIGSITDLKTSCLAAGRPDLAYQLVEQLQNALDSLKWKVDVVESVVSGIRKEVSPAPWLRYKRERRVSDMPLHLDVADTDKVGRLYNILRKEFGDILSERMAIEDFRGLFSGAIVTKEMFEECQLVNSIFADVATQITEREEQLRLEYNNAQALWEPWLWPDSVRMKHGLIAGGTGAGKSTFLENVIAQDLNRRFDGRPMPMVIFDGKGDQDFLERLLRRLSGKHGCLRGSSHPSRVSAIPCGRRLENSDSKY